MHTFTKINTSGSELTTNPIFSNSSCESPFLKRIVYILKNVKKAESLQIKVGNRNVIVSKIENGIN